VVGYQAGVHPLPGGEQLGSTERGNSVESNEFYAECNKCGDPLTIHESDRDENGYYLCRDCALSKAGYEPGDEIGGEAA